MNPVLIPTHNNLELTKKCVASVHGQDIPTTIMFYDNGSSDGTSNWLPDNSDQKGDMAWRSQFNEGVSKAWNFGLNHLFNVGAEHVLVINADTVLPPWFYFKLINYDVPFITGISADTMAALRSPSSWVEPAVSPDFSAFFIRRDCWEKVGEFNVAMVNYCSDCDYHVRAHRLGIPLLNSGVPFYHERSSTIRLAGPQERRQLQLGADADREVFRGLYGCVPGDPEYARLFQ